MKKSKSPTTSIAEVPQPKPKGKGHAKHADPNGPGRGGARANSGQKTGTEQRITKYLRKHTESLLAEGASPLEVMLDNMRYWHSKAGKLMAEILAGVGTKPSLELIAALKDLGDFRAAAQSCAEGAAQFCHPKLAAIAFKGDLSMTLTKVTKNMTPEEAAQAYASMLKAPAMKQIELTAQEAVEAEIED